MKSPIVLLAAFLATIASLPAQNSAFGHWSKDLEGLPEFEFTAPLPVQTVDTAGKPYPLKDDPFFLLGNYRLTVFAHVSGIYQLMTGERGWARVNAAEKDKSYGDNSATVTVIRAGATNTFDLVGMQSLAADPQRCQRVFGTGYARYDFAPAEGLSCSRVLSVPPSPEVNGGVPAFVVNVRVSNVGSTPIQVKYAESVLANYVAVIGADEPDAYKLVTYTNRTTIDAKHALLRADIFAISKDPSVFRSRDFACKYDGYPPSLLLHVASTEKSELRSHFETAAISPGKDRLTACVEFELQPGKTLDFNLVIGLAPDHKPDEILSLGRSLKPTTDGEYFRVDWKRRLPNLDGEKDPIFRREMVWDAYALEAMATYSEYYHETFVPQGMTYDYEMGSTAAPRDHLQHSLALCYTDPALAKSCLRFVLKKMTGQGEIKYTDYGFGKTSNLAWNTSDQQLYLFLAVAEYLRITRDVGFLAETTEYLPIDANYMGTTLDKLDRAFMYLRDEIGTGSHGLTRLMNSDWNDDVYQDIPVMRYYFSAESHMNGAMALVVFPDLIKQLELAANDKQLIAQRERLIRLIDGMKRYHAQIQDAFYKDLGDRAFSRRLYLNQHNPLGENVMYVEPQSFLLQAPDFPVERKKVLLEEIRKRLLNGEVLGPRQQESPPSHHAQPAGTGENGGFWYALNGPMILGVSTFDNQAAWELLRDMTFDNFSKHFPNYWVGQWTAPDTLSSSVAGAIAGLPRPGWATFAAYCAHAHAWPLYCYYRLKEIGPEPSE